MNYYPFHIRDYAAATSHLTDFEDLFHRRLIDWYCLDERPLPDDLKLIYRRVRAVGDEQKAAVRTVLDEFFERVPAEIRHAPVTHPSRVTVCDEFSGPAEKSADDPKDDNIVRVDSLHVWVNHRCDEEIERARVKSDANRERLDAERERQARHRELRKSLFEQLRAFEIVPNFNTSTDDLRALLSRVTTDKRHAPVTRDEPVTIDKRHAPVTVDATAIANSQEPIANSQEPKVLKTEEFGKVANAPFPAERPKTQNATPKKAAPDPGAPILPVDEIFGRGVPLLTASGITDKAARSMLGLMRKQHGDTAVVAALQRCADERAIEPVAFLQGALKATTAGKAGEHPIVKRNREAGDAFMRGDFGNRSAPADDGKTIDV